jgi:hypothetical protein
MSNRKAILFSVLYSLLSICGEAVAAPEYARAGFTGRNGASAAKYRATTVAAQFVSTAESGAAAESLSAAAQADPFAKKRDDCMARFGNVWASRNYATPDGVDAGRTLPEADNPADNICYGRVAVSSSFIRNIAQYSPPRYFAAGQTIQCGAWIDEGQFDDIILDANKGARIIGTIVASIAGGAAGFGLTELIGRQIKGFQGQKDLDGAELLRSQVLGLKRKSPKDYDDYTAALNDLKTKCDAIETASEAPEKCGEYSAVLAFIEKGETK